MLEMGVLPDVAAATAATMIMFTAASASAVYMGFGTVRSATAASTGVRAQTHRACVKLLCLCPLPCASEVLSLVNGVYRFAHSLVASR